MSSSSTVAEVSSNPGKYRSRRRGGAGPRLAGVDGCRGGWVCAVAHGDRTACFLAADFDAVMAALDGAAVVGIDIPIGLPAAGARDCDLLARRRLGAGRGSSVFPAPPRSVLGAADYAEACARRVAIEGLRMSRQAYNILPKIAQVDRVVRRIGQQRIFEVHPELAFAEMAGRPMAGNKRTRAGHEERRGLLQQAFRPADIAAALAALPRRQVARDDVVDALVCLWSAHRIHAGEALRLPTVTQRDEAGLEMAIWA